jgi:hypothetical protein
MTTTVLHRQLEKDDHDNPSILVRADGRLIVFYCGHNKENIVYCRISSNPEDASSWEEERKIETVHKVTYATPVMLSEEQNRIYLFTRDIDFKPTMTWSDDQGLTWAPWKKLLDSAGRRPYVKLESNGVDEIHFAFTDGHPGEVPDNNLYYMKYKGGSFYRSDNSLIAAADQLPIHVASTERIYTASRETGKAWVWDIALQSGKPVIAYTRFPSDTDHRYHYIRHDGNGWQDRLIAGGGRWFPQTREGERVREPNYSGGIALDHTDPSVVYLSRPVDGTYEIEKRVTADGGASWTAESVTSGSRQLNVRPFVPVNRKSGELEVLWMSGEYVHYTHYRTSIMTNRTES